MARAKRHYIPGHVWHITHRCHKREFLLKFARDQGRWLQWLLEAKKRYGLVILDYIVTSNHIYLLVVDDGDRDVIPRFIQLVAGRVGQEYNQRKNRKGAFWEDRYHATVVETGEHLLLCIVYIDLNMVRTSVVDHLSQWSFSGYGEIQEPRRKCALIAYERLLALAGFTTYEEFHAAYSHWADEYLGEGGGVHDSMWTRSIVVGSEGFVERTKEKLGIHAKGRKVLETGEAFQLREPEAGYRVKYGAKNEDIGTENSYFWKINLYVPAS